MEAFLDGLKGLALLVALVAVFGGFPVLALWMAKPFLDEEDRKYFAAVKANRAYDPVKECEAVMARTNPLLYEEYMRDKERRESR